jgi:hypothetical protein
MAKKASSKPDTSLDEKAEHDEAVGTVSLEPTPDEITALVRASLGGISRTMAKRILTERAAAK